MERMPTEYEEKMSIIRGIAKLFVMIHVLIFIAGLLFMFREYKIWFSLPYCEMEQCDETFLTFTNDSIHSSFCRSNDGNVASNIPLDDVDQICGLSISSSVFLNKAINFSFEYDIIDFQICLTDFAEDARGKIVLHIGLLTDLIYNPIHTEKLGWRLHHSNTNETLELRNSSNATVSTITKTSKSKIILKYQLVIYYNSGNIKIQIVNRKTKDIMDTIYMTTKRSEYIYAFFGLCDQSYSKLSVQSLSDGRTFNRTTIFHRLYLSDEDTIARNYRMPGGNDAENSLILFSQDITIHGCSKLCVIPFTLYVSPFSLKEEQWLELSVGSATDTDEFLLLFGDTCTSYLAHMFGYHTKCLSINENVTSSMIPNVNVFGNFSCTLLIDKETNLTSIDVDLQKYSFPMPRSLRSSHPILRLKLFTKTKISMMLSNKMNYRYTTSIMNGILVFKIMSYAINQVDMLLLLFVTSVYVIYKFLSYIVYFKHACISRTP